MKPAIQIEGLSKRYQLGASRGGGYRTLRESLMAGLKAPFARRNRNTSAPTGEFWALKDVSFDIQPGEIVGLIGRNGAGKSTALKVLSRITEPTSGRAVIRGRVGSLLEVGTGFHHELTGRENVYLSGAILGMTRSEIKRKFDEIVAFAEMSQFLDTPVKRYSSGMFVRLAFAVAANLDPEILIVDEVLAVGDVEFQKRCLGKMNEAAKSGRTVMFVSHSMAHIQSLCSRCILLQQGQVVEDGKPLDVIRAYSVAAGGTVGLTQTLTDHPGRRAGSVPSMRRVEIRPNASEAIFMGSDLDVTVDFAFKEPLSGVDLGFTVKDSLQVPVFGVNNKILPCEQPKTPFQSGTVTGRVPKLPLIPGVYSLDLYLGSRGVDTDVIFDAIRFEVLPFDVFGTGRHLPRGCGNIFWPATWRIEPGVAARGTE